MGGVAYYCPEEETLEPAQLAALQRRKLTSMLREVTATNAFYRAKLAGIDFDPISDPMEKLPFTSRAELERDQAENLPYGTNLTRPIGQYVRLHQTSGSGGGQPVRWLDTPENWLWWKKLWGTIYTAAGVTRQDRLFFPFSFGPFVGFWAAFESAVALGNLSLPAGAMTTPARLRFMIENGCTVVCCTPTYALRMAEVAREEGIDLAGSAVKKLIVAGEPGGSIPATRLRIEDAFGARVFDHCGMTEIGALGFECESAPGGLHLIESECIAEVIDPSTGDPVGDGEEGELVLTNLGRVDSPLIRYRTRDQVRLTRGGRCACGRWFARLEGGILGRIDDMVVVRGNNIFPAALESIIRRFDGVGEYRVEVVEDGSLTELRVDLEAAAGRSDAPELAAQVTRAIQDAFNFRADVKAVRAGSLPRFEMKAKRFTRTTRRA
jgi:phenylacetate-CoA ligase